MEYKAHPWHGVDYHKSMPETLTAFIEIVPTDTVKYEIDKASGYLKIDRPQLYSNVVPSLYGFLPKTYCGEKIAALATKRLGKLVTKGDGDPLDICVLTEKNITHGDILVNAKPIGGFTLLDKGEADDKILAVLENDQIFGKINDISELPPAILKRIKHYFLTYKNLPEEPIVCELSEPYNRQEAINTILISIEDYKDFWLNRI
jgi:inorganic pyrophosphatase